MQEWEEKGVYAHDRVAKPIMVPIARLLGDELHNGHNDQRRSGLITHEIVALFEKWMPSDAFGTSRATISPIELCILLPHPRFRRNPGEWPRARHGGPSSASNPKPELQNRNMSSKT